MTGMPPNGAPIGGGFSEGELKFASFWVRNRMALTRAGFLALIVVNVALWLYVLWGIIDAFAISYPRESRITSEIASNQITFDALEADRPKNVQTGGAMVFETTDGRYDMAVDVENPNGQWWADFNYRFNISGQQTPVRSGFIMPLTKTTITELGYKPPTRGGTSAQLVVDNIRWHRVDPALVGATYKDFEIERFNVAFENIAHESSLVIGSKQIGRTTFDLVNRGAFGYWAMDVIVKLYRGSSVVGINRITLTKVIPGETRHVELDWFEKLPSSITRTEIIPVINFLDASSYLPTEQFRP